MDNTYVCPLCGEERELVPHPEDAGRLVAYCTCRGSRVSIVDMPVSVPVSSKSTRQPKSYVPEGEK